ncbi:ABC transporter substrate-binding protein [Deinococcus sp. YIM 134068]|uniref:ABC transporter substrate-binding protein n=1 Tax=Deinococcus lichenicola TaxID=3118910 RepID=UPI002F91FB9C
MTHASTCLRLLTLTLTTFALALCAPHAGARPLSAIKESGVLRVATPGDIPPFTMGTSVQPSGFEIELIEQLAADLGVNVSYERVRLDGLTKALQENRADVALGALAHTSTRENRTDFTRPTVCAGVALVSLDPRLKEPKQLVGKTIGVSAGSVMQAYVQKFPFEKRVTVYSTNEELTMAVLTRNVDATFVYSAMQLALKRQFPKVPVNFGPELWSVPIGMMLGEDSDSTRLALNASLDRFAKTPPTPR